MVRRKKHMKYKIQKYIIISIACIGQTYAACPLSTCNSQNGSSGTGWSHTCVSTGAHMYVKVKYDRENYTINMYADEYWTYCGGGGGSSTHWFPVWTDYDFLDASYNKTSYEYGEVNGNEVGKETTRWAKAKTE